MTYFGPHLVTLTWTTSLLNTFQKKKKTKLNQNILLKLTEAKSETKFIFMTMCKIVMPTIEIVKPPKLTYYLKN